MKTYLRILGFARPLGKFALPYALTSVLSVIFGLINFTLIMPVLQVLFGVADDPNRLQAMLVKPEFELTIDYFISLFNYYFSQEVAVRGEFGALQFVCLILIASTFLSNLFRYFSTVIIETLRTHTLRNLRQTVYTKASSMHLGFYSQERKGDIMSRITTDVQEVEYSVASTLTVIFREPITLIGYFVVMLKISVHLTLFTLLVIPVSGLIIGTITKRLRRDAALGQESLSQLITILDETLGGMRIIKAFNATGYVQRKFNNENSRYTRIMRRMAQRRELSSPLSEFMGVLIVAAILLYGGSLVLGNSPDMDASAFITYVGIFSQVLRPAKALTTAFSNIQKGLASGDRIFQLLDTPAQVLDKPDAVVLPAFSKRIEFRNVSFSYGDKLVLDNVSFTINHGETVALVGPSGGGKSTIADLIPRFYDVKSGQILIDGLDVRDLQVDSLRSQMGIVTQESILFNDTIYNNIAFNKTEATEQEVIHAATTANAHQFILSTTNGYQTNIGDRGSRLSGGQRQRISIARAVLQNPAILILDEATSALDTESEKLVQDALYKLMRNRTSLVIAHRLSTVQHADKILVVQNGKIVQQGSHDELLVEEGGIYRKLQQMQLH